MQRWSVMQSSPPAQRSRATRTLVVATLLGTGALFATGMLAAAPDAIAQKQDERCFETENEARYRPYGYDHYVIIRNGCVHDLVCSVSTNVNPGPIEVVVPVGATVEVLTYQRSPARTFTSTVTCSAD
jgi:hypothetical protein